MDERLAASVEDETAGDTDTNELERWTAQSVATMSTQNESKQCSWLKTISIWTIMQNYNVFLCFGASAWPVHLCGK